MKKRILVMVMGLVIAGALVGCGSKNLSKMTPQEIYKYVSAMSEEDFEKYYSDLTTDEHFNIGTVVPNSVKSVGYEIQHGMSYDFYISKDTGAMVDFEANTAFGATWEQKAQ